MGEPEAQDVEQRNQFAVRPVHSDPPYFEALSIICSKFLFVSTIIAISSLYFVVTGLQFWISDYLRQVIGVPQGQVFLTFALVSITAPMSGVILGGKVSNSIGGYRSEDSLLFCTVLAGLGALLGLPIPYLDDFFWIVLLLWLVFFVGGALLPTLTGVMISSIPSELRSLGCSVAQFFEHLFGYLPAPTLYGWIIAQDDDPKSRSGMKLLMYSGSIGFAALLYALLKQFKIKRRRFQKGKQHLRELYERNDQPIKDVDKKLGEIELNWINRNAN